AIFRKIFPKTIDPSLIKPLQTQQSNSSVLYDHYGILKFYRRNEFGIHPELEVGELLVESAKFTKIPRIAASIEYERDRQTTLLGVFHEYIPNQGDAWHYTLDEILKFFEKVLAKYSVDNPITLPADPFTIIIDKASEQAIELLGSYIESAY